MDALTDQRSLQKSDARTTYFAYRSKGLMPGVKDMRSTVIDTVELPADNPQRLHDEDVEKCRYKLSL